MTITEYAGPDDYPITQIPDEPWWSENYAAMYASPQERISVFFSIGRWHSDPSVWRELLMVALPDGRVLHTRGFARNGTPTGPGGPLSRYDILDPGKSLRLTYDGPALASPIESLIAAGPEPQTSQRCTVDLRFEAAAPLWNMRGDSVEAGSLAGAMHIDHVGTPHGTVEYDGHTYVFDGGYAMRDHSRGRREVSQYAGHNWINGQFPDGRGFYLYAMRLQGSDTIGMSNAAMTRDGEIATAEVVHTELARGWSDAGQPHRIVLRSELGLMEIEVGEATNTLASSMVAPYDTFPGAVRNLPAAYFIDEPSHLRCDGVDGFGWVERGFTERPLA